MRIDPFFPLVKILAYTSHSKFVSVKVSDNEMKVHWIGPNSTSFFPVVLYWLKFSEFSLNLRDASLTEVWNAVLTSIAKVLKCLFLITINAKHLFLGVLICFRSETKMGVVGTWVLVLKIDLCSASSIENSRWDLLNVIAEQRSILKNHQNIHYTPNLNQWKSVRFNEFSLNLRDSSWFKFCIIVIVMPICNCSFM